MSFHHHRAWVRECSLARMGRVGRVSRNLVATACDRSGQYSAGGDRLTLKTQGRELSRSPVRNATLRMLIRTVHGVQDPEIVVGPRWMNVDRVNIQARGDVGNSPALPVAHGGEPNRLQLMMQSLLAAQFKLVVHRDRQEADVYAIRLLNGSGVNPRGGVLYCTTFPCHNCAKHIIAAGIERVFYVEPYPKSLAAELHGDAIAVDQKIANRVCFLAFTGIAARRYFDLFSLQVSSGRPVRRKDGSGVQKAPWDRNTTIPRVPMTADSYIEREMVANLTIRDAIRKGKANETRKKQRIRR